MAGRTDLDSIINTYLKQVKNRQEFPQLELNKLQEHVSVSVTDPFHMVNIRSNLQPFFGKEFFQRISSTETEFVESETDGIKIRYQRLKNIKTSPIPVQHLDLPSKMKRRDVVKFMIYLNSLIYVNKTHNLPSPQESIFPIKNDLSLADDFVPHELMGMVEGSLTYDPIQTLEEIQPFREMPIIFGVGRVLEDKVSAWKFLVPIPMELNSDPEIVLSRLMTFMEGQITEMELAPWYRNFLFGRITRSVSYQLSRKGNRALKPPMFSDLYVRILSEHDLVDNAGEIPMIKEDRDANSMKVINSEAEKLSRRLANDWLDGEVQLPGLRL